MNNTKTIKRTAKPKRLSIQITSKEGINVVGVYFPGVGASFPDSNGGNTIDRDLIDQVCHWAYYDSKALPESINLEGGLKINFKY